MSCAKDMSSLQKIILKLDLARNIIADSNKEAHGIYTMNYMIIYYAIWGSIKVPNSEPLRGTKNEHNNRYRRREITRDRAEDREWLMSEAPEKHWKLFTNEDWSAIRDQIQYMWMEFNEICRANQHPSFPTKLSRDVRRHLAVVGDV